MTYPLNHMARCFHIHQSPWNNLPEPPLSLVDAWLAEEDEYFKRNQFDFTDAYKTQILPTDDNSKLCRPVVIDDTVFYDYEKEDGHKVSAEEERAKGVRRREKGEGVFYYQCPLCKRLFELYPLGHLESCRFGKRRKGPKCNLCGAKDSVRGTVVVQRHYDGCQFKSADGNKSVPDRGSPRTRLSLEAIERAREMGGNYNQDFYESYGYSGTEDRMKARNDLGYWLGFKADQSK